MVAVADLEISVRRADTDYTVELRFTPAPGGAWTPLITGTPPIVQLDMPALRQESLDPDAYGRLLTGMLFADGRVRDAFAQARAYVEGASAVLRLRLRLDAADGELHSIRWELLHDPLAADRAPLAQNERILFSRYLDSVDMTPVQPRRITQPTAVIAVANPTNLADYELAPIDVRGEVERLSQALAGFPVSVVASGDNGGQATLMAILAALRKGADILYLACHGTLREEGAYLWLERVDGTVDRIEGARLVRQIRDLVVRPQLIVLAACQSGGRSHNHNALAALGAQLASAGIAAVVAMQDNVAMASVAALVPVLFHELRRDGQIDRALAVARRALHGQDDWWQPVLLLRLPQLWLAPDGGPINLLPKPACPYPGMVPFRAEDTRFFYGRETEIQHMLQHLRYQRRLLVIGPSGSGKSSLVRAGLLPRLEQSSPFPQGFWLVRMVRLGAQPVEALSAALGGDVEHPASAVVALLAAHPSAQRLLLVIDPFEELFTSSSREDQQTVIALLQALQAVEDCALLLAMRADFYPDLMTSALWPIDARQRLEVAPLQHAALRQAIEQPAADVGVQLEPGLVEQLLADAADEPGALPLLQETLVLLWGAMQGRLLRLDDYRRLGSDGRSGLAVALATKADALLVELPPVQQALARRIFLRLIQFGEGRADTRRQQPVTALHAASDDPILFERTLRHLVDQRMLTVSGEETDAHKKVDIAHETLIQAWPTLHDWLVERREAEQIRRRLEDKAAEWMRLDRQGGLLDAVELVEAERWLVGADAIDLGVHENLPELVQVSRRAIEQVEQERERVRQEQLQRAQALAEEQQRRAEAERQRAEEQAEASRRLRRNAVYLVAALLLAVSTAVAAGWFGFAAQRSAKAEQDQKATAVAASQRAEREATAALARQLTAQAGRDASAQPDRALLFTVEANTLANEAQARGTLLSVLVTNQRLAGLMRGHTDIVWSVAFSPDGKTLASASFDGTIRLWDVAARQPLGQPLQGHTNSVNGVAFSPDGKTLASASSDRTVRLWDVATRQPLGDPLEGHTNGVNDVAFSPDGRILASASTDGTIRLWDVATRQPLGQPLQGHTANVLSVAFSPDSRMLAEASYDGTIRLWDVAARQPLGQPLQGHTSSVWSVAFSPDGRTLASASNDHTVRLWDVAARQPLGQPLQAHTDSVWSVAFSPDGKTLASASNDRTVRLWDVATRQPLGDPLEGHTDSVRSVAFSPDGKTLASASSDGTIRLWDMAARQPLGQPLQGHTDSVWSVAFSPDGKMLASASYDRTIRLWDVAARQPLGQPLQGHSDSVNGVAFSPDGRTLASASSDGTIRLWDVATRQPLGDPLQSHTNGGNDVAFSPDGKLLASASEDHTVRLWDVATRQPLGQPLQGHSDRVNGVAFSPDGKTLASASEDHTVRLWDVATRQPLGQPLQGHTDSVWRVAFSPDGKMLASASSDGTIRLWDVATRQPLGQPLQGHTSSVWRVAFSPDGKMLASASSDGTIRLWDVATRQPLGQPLQGHTSSVRGVAFSPDGKMLASASSDRTVRLWEVSLESWIARACRIAGRNLTQDEWLRFVSPERPYHQTCPQFPPGEGATATTP